MRTVRWRRKRSASARQNVLLRPENRSHYEEAQGLGARVRRIGMMMVWLTVGMTVGWVVYTGSQRGDDLIREWFAVNEVTVVGVERLTKEQVLAQIALRPREALLYLSPSDFRERLALHPWILSAQVERRFPHTLAISITERQPAAVVKTDTKQVLVDREGQVLETLSEGASMSLPILVGADPLELEQGTRESRQALQAGIRLAELLRQSSGIQPEVDISHPSNAVAYVKGVRFQFGPTSFEEQWNKYKKLEQVLPGSGGAPEQAVFNEIDLRYQGKVIVRERG